jgi:hypothetical protein
MNTKGIIAVIRNRRFLIELSAAFVICASVIATPSAYGQTTSRYVRAGATGGNDGSDWNNAYKELGQIVYSSQGTIYVAAGTYLTALPPLDNTTNNVTIKRATTTDHGTDTGWQAAYDGQVTVTNAVTKFWSVNGANGFTFDGKYDGSWHFAVQGQNAYNGKVEIWDASNWTIRGLELDGQGCEPAIENGPEDGFRLGGNSAILLEHNFVHDFWYCSYENVNNPGHSDGTQMPSANVAEIRYNVFKNDGMLLFIGDCTWNNQWVSDVSVHHNVFIQQAGLGDNYRMMDLKAAGQTATDYIKIENNTFYKDANFSGLTLNESTDCQANTKLRSIRNNIFVNGSFALSSGWGAHSNNNYFGGEVQTEADAVGGDSRFVNAAALDFHLQTTSPDIGKGISLGYTADMDGVVIPLGGFLDIGAYESIRSRPAPPTGLRVTAR